MEGTFVAKLSKWIEAALSLFLAFAVTAVALLVFVQVMLRYVFARPLMGIEELLLFPMTWLYLTGALKASQERNHIIAKVLEVFIRRKRFAHLLRAAAAVVSTGVLCWLCLLGYDLLRYTLRVNKLSPTLYLPIIYSDGVVFFVLLFMVIYTFIECVDEFRKFLATPSDVAFIREV